MKFSFFFFLILKRNCKAHWCEKEIVMTNNISKLRFKFTFLSNCRKHVPLLISKVKRLYPKHKHPDEIKQLLPIWLLKSWNSFQLDYSRTQSVQMILWNILENLGFDSQTISYKPNTKLNRERNICLIIWSRKFSLIITFKDSSTKYLNTLSDS